MGLHTRKRRAKEIIDGMPYIKSNNDSIEYGPLGLKKSHVNKIQQLEYWFQRIQILQPNHV